jgi:phage shock protein B
MDWDLVVILVFVLLLVALAQYGRHRAAQRVGAGPALDAALATAGRLEERIDALERVLDEDVPGWRSRVRG